MVRVIQITDAHVVAAGTLWHEGVDTNAQLRALVVRVNAFSPDLVVLSGDLTENGRPEEYAAARSILDGLLAPLLLIPGNHDERGAMRTAFEDVCDWAGETFLQCSALHGGLGIVALDTVSAGETGGTFCSVREAEAGALLETMRDAPVLIFGHHPPVPVGLAFMDAFGFSGEPFLARAIARHTDVLVYCCGHVHGDVSSRWAGRWIMASPAVAAQLSVDQGVDEAVILVKSAPWLRIFDWTEERGLSVKTTQ